MPTPFLVALQFLTVIPIYLNVPPEPRETGASLNWYPVVGLLIGVILVLASWLFGAFGTSMTAAALVLATWVVVTGALHLDGLGDSADGLMGSSREETFRIMHDSRAGVMAIAAITLVLLIKFAALTALLGVGAWTALLVAPLIARAGVQVLFLTTPCAREQGIGADLVAHIDRDRLMWSAAIAMVLALVLMGFAAWYVLPLLALVFVALRALMMRRLLGTTGDSAGALIEILETAAIVLLI